MLAAWDRFEEFIALWRKVNISEVERALLVHNERHFNSASVDGGPATLKLEPKPLPKSKTAAEAITANRSDPASTASLLAVTSGALHTANLESVDPQETALALMQSEPSGRVSAEELMMIFGALKPNTQQRGLRWVSDGCPTASLPDEHFVITENLLPFRDAARPERLHIIEHLLTEAAAGFQNS